MTTAQKRCNEIVDELRGTCKSLHEVCTDEEMNDPVVLNVIDMELFECSVCSWWCELNEAVENNDEGEDVCTDCGE